jgi:hypothetical protein
VAKGAGARRGGDGIRGVRVAKQYD